MNMLSRALLKPRLVRTRLASPRRYASDIPEHTDPPVPPPPSSPAEGVLVKAELVASTFCGFTTTTACIKILPAV